MAFAPSEAQVDKLKTLKVHSSSSCTAFAWVFLNITRPLLHMVGIAGVGVFSLTQALALAWHGVNVGIC